MAYGSRPSGRLRGRHLPYSGCIHVDDAQAAAAIICSKAAEVARPTRQDQTRRRAQDAIYDSQPHTLRRAHLSFAADSIEEEYPPWAS